MKETTDDKKTTVEKIHLHWVRSRQYWKC